MHPEHIDDVVRDLPENAGWLARFAVELLEQDQPSIEPDAAELLRDLDPRLGRLRVLDQQADGEISLGYANEAMVITGEARRGLNELLKDETELRPQWGWLFAHRGSPRRKRQRVEDVRLQPDEAALEQSLATALETHLEERY